MSRYRTIVKEDGTMELVPSPKTKLEQRALVCSVDHTALLLRLYDIVAQRDWAAAVAMVPAAEPSEE